MTTSLSDLQKMDTQAMRQRLLEDYAKDVDDFIAKHPDPKDRFLVSFVFLAHQATMRRADFSAEVSKALENAQAGASDFHHWAKMESWSFEETSALFAGLDPRKIAHVVGRIADASGESEIARRFAESEHLLARAGSPSSVTKNVYWRPVQAMTWADQFEVLVPQALRDAVRRMWSESAPAQEHLPAPKMRSDRETTLLRVIAGIWKLSSLPEEPTPAADKISGLFDLWGWEKPTKATIAETVLAPAAQLDRIRK